MKMANALLYEAVVDGNLIKLSRALSKGANPNERCLKADDGSYPIHIAASLGVVRVMEELKKCYINLDALDINGNTPIIRAALAGEEGAVRWFLKQGVNFKLLNHMRKSVIDAAEYGGHIELRKMLEECFRNPYVAADIAKFKSQSHMRELVGEFAEYSKLCRDARRAKESARNYKFVGAQKWENPGDFRGDNQFNLFDSAQLNVHQDIFEPSGSQDASFSGGRGQWQNYNQDFSGPYGSQGVSFAGDRGQWQHYNQGFSGPYGSQDASFTGDRGQCQHCNSGFSAPNGYQPKFY